MTWIKLDDQWMDHPKMLRAGRDARDLWLASVTWCNKQHTDGYFPPEALPTLAAMAWPGDSKLLANCQDFANRLLEVRLWEFDGEQYQVHDFLEYQPTKEQSEVTSEARKAAGKAGGVAKAAKSKQNPSKTASKTLAKSWQKSAPSPSPYPLTPPSDNEGGVAAQAPPSPLAPAVQVYLDNGGKFPTGSLQDGTSKKDRGVQYITEHIRDGPDSLAFWGRVVAGYCAQWKPTSYTVMVQDYYLVNRIPGQPKPPVGGNGHVKQFGIATEANRGTHNRPATDEDRRPV